MSRFRRKFRSNASQVPELKRARRKVAPSVAGKIIIWFIAIYLLMKGAALLWHWWQGLG